MSIQPSKQKQHSDQVKMQIIDTAMLLFQEHGFDQVSVKDIAAAMGVTTGTLYHHFKNKQEIMDAVFSQHRKGFDKLLEMYQNSADPVHDLQEFLGDFMVHQVIQDGKEYTQYRIFSVLKFEHKDSVFEKIVLTLVERAIAMGLIKSTYTADAISDLLLSVYRSSVYQYGVSAVPFDIQTITYRRIKIVLDGLTQMV